MKYNIEINFADAPYDGTYYLGRGRLCTTSHQIEAKRFASESEAFSFASHIIGTCADTKIVSLGTWAIIPAPDTF